MPGQRRLILGVESREHEDPRNAADHEHQRREDTGTSVGQRQRHAGEHGAGADHQDRRRDATAQPWKQRGAGDRTNANATEQQPVSTGA